MFNDNDYVIILNKGVCLHIFINIIWYDRTLSWLVGGGKSMAVTQVFRLLLPTTDLSFAFPLKTLKYIRKIKDIMKPTNRITKLNV